MGDFNLNLINCSDHQSTENFVNTFYMLEKLLLFCFIMLFDSLNTDDVYSTQHSCSYLESNDFNNLNINPSCDFSMFYNMSGVSWPSGLAYRNQVLVLAAECGFESRP